MTTPVKRCTKCGNEYPATPEYFHLCNQTSDNLHRWCKPCANLNRRQSYLRNRDKVIARQREYDQRNQEKQSARMREWRQRNKEKVSEMNREWYQKNRDRQRPYQREWQRRWRDANREAVRLKWRLRENLVRSTGSVSPQYIEQQYQHQGGRCYWCSKLVENDYHVDHVIPVSRGGTNTPGNLVITCPFCNRSKGNRLPYTEWTPPNPLQVDL
jgi:CRISPR/Cas system Type II protein with McrA/HNH and RuvC-like nuclease domain